MMGFYGRKVNGKEVVENFRVKEVKWGEGPKKHALNPCRQCGSEIVDLWYVGAGDGGWRVICSDCGWLPDRLCKTEQEAVDLWNGVIT